MFKQAIHATAWRAERLLDQLKGQREANRIIEPYIGYATPEHLVVRGRVLSALRRGQSKPDQSKRTNFKQMFSLFLTDEVGGEEVRAAGVTGMSDEEGYFTLLLPRGTDVGWINVEVTLTADNTSVSCPVLIPQRGAVFGVISDIDDTMVLTGAYSLARNLWTSFTGNVSTRRIFPDAVNFMNKMSDQARNPVY